MDKPNIDGEVLDSIKRFLAWFLPTTLGVATKLAYESRMKAISRKYVITSLIIACFVGFLADKICTHYGFDDLRGIIVALAALASESIVQYIFKNTGNGITAILKRMFNINIDNPTQKQNPQIGEPDNQKPKDGSDSINNS